MQDTKIKPMPEVDFISGYMDLIDAGKIEQALSYLIENLPRMLNSKINRKEKLNHLLFMPRMIQNIGDTKHGTSKLLRKAKSVVSTLGAPNLRERNVFVDFGAGAHDPVALSTYFYLNGFDQAIAIDILPPRNETYSALAMREILTDARIDPDRFLLPDSDRELFFNRLNEFDLCAFGEGRFFDGFAGTEGRLRYVVDDIVNVDLPENSVSLLVSFAVFEHVMDMEGVTSFIHRHTAPGGLGFHFIDLADHRSYRHDGVFNRFSFLTEEKGPANVNRLRRSEHISHFVQAGFEILVERGKTQDVPPETLAAYRPRWAAMGDLDKSSYNLVLATRKPESTNPDRLDER